jgi:hypothetical protein
MKTVELTKGTKVNVSDTFFCKGYEGIIVSEGLTTSKYGDTVYTVKKTSDNTDFNVAPETVSEVK